MSKLEDQRLISSKEILEKTGISRATLNNYIKMGILPRPVIRKPENGETNVKSLGYFPVTALDNIDRVKALKRNGHSMPEVAHILKDTSIPENEDSWVAQQTLKEEKLPPLVRYPEKSDEGGRLKLSLEDVSDPAYLLNYDFEVKWINRKAEDVILNQKIMFMQETVSTNIFKLFFNWEFQSRIKNWKDLVTFHMSFAKFKYSKTWLARLYKGISQRELNVLEGIYDDTSISPHHTIREKHISLLMQGDFTEQYRIYSMFFNEGILFIYIPSGSLS
ncbi:MAG: hypothetical protein JRI43_04960 [Deltaproteobacteria bacterium]|nr:hypothetical protein [Deltaproteobacteria bacterium]